MMKNGKFRSGLTNVMSEADKRARETRNVDTRGQFASVLTQSGPGYWLGRLGGIVGGARASARNRSYRPLPPSIGTQPDAGRDSTESNAFEFADPQADERNPNASQRPR